MRKFLALGAAAFLAAFTGGAGAAGRTTEISLDGYCNIYHVRQVGVIVAAQDTPSCTATFGGGLLGTVKGFGKSIALALQDPSNPGVQLMLELSYPFVTGGTFELYQATDGSNFALALDGTYSLHAAAEQGPKSNISVTSAVRR